MRLARDEKKNHQFSNVYLWRKSTYGELFDWSIRIPTEFNAFQFWQKFIVYRRAIFYPRVWKLSTSDRLPGLELYAWTKKLWKSTGIAQRKLEKLQPAKNQASILLVETLIGEPVKDSGAVINHSFSDVPDPVTMSAGARSTHVSSMEA